MHPVFSIAVHQKPTHRVFGLDLQPLTLGHLFLLREYRSAVLPGAKGCSLGHVLVATFICSTPHSKSRKNLVSGLDLFISRWAKVARKFDLVVECGKFFAYLHECYSCPSIKAGDAKGSSSATQSPDEWRTLAMLMADFHMTREQAYEAPLSFATALWAANGERTGRLELVPFGMDNALEAAWQHQHKLDLEAQRLAAANGHGEGETSCSA